MVGLLSDSGRVCREAMSGWMGDLCVKSADFVWVRSEGFDLQVLGLEGRNAVFLDERRIAL